MSPSISVYLSLASTQPLQPSTPNPQPPWTPQLSGRESTLQLKEAFFRKMCFFLRKCWICWICSKASLKMCFFLRKCWISWVCWMFLELTGPFWTPQLPEGEHNIQHYSWKNHLFQKNVLLSADMLNMLNMFESLSPKMCFFLGKCSICWMFLELIGLIQKGL